MAIEALVMLCFRAMKSRHQDAAKIYAKMAALRHERPAPQQEKTNWLHNNDEQRVVASGARREESLARANLSTTLFRRIAGAEANVNEIVLPVSTPEPEAIPFLSLNAFEARRESR